MSPAPRRPRLVTTAAHAYYWEWPSDPENVAEDERIAEVYHQERMQRRAEYDRKRAEYLRAVEAGTVGEVTTECRECGEPVYMGLNYCSNECAGVAAGERDRAVSASVTPYGACEVCDRPVAQPASHQGWKRRYCSKRCKRRAQNARARRKEIA